MGKRDISRFGDRFSVTAQLQFGLEELIWNKAIGLLKKIQYLREKIYKKSALMEIQTFYYEFNKYTFEI